MKELAAEIKEPFDLFVKAANKTLLHQYDWERFYRFIRACHGEGIAVKDNDLRECLEAANFSAEIIKELSFVYGHGLGILKPRSGAG